MSKGKESSEKLKMLRVEENEGMTPEESWISPGIFLDMGTSEEVLKRMNESSGNAQKKPLEEKEISRKHEIKKEPDEETSQWPETENETVNDNTAQFPVYVKAEPPSPPEEGAPAEEINLSTFSEDKSNSSLSGYINTTGELPTEYLEFKKSSNISQNVKSKTDHLNEIEIEREITKNQDGAATSEWGSQKITDDDSPNHIRSPFAERKSSEKKMKKDVLTVEISLDNQTITLRSKKECKDAVIDIVILKDVEMVDE